ncbi:MAG: response regulator transcription factor [Saprospiraceae bacterium]|jgi:DNA-binding NarL/FixJ family response regulator|nr:response regulator transcription factor [Saprospiraceae bacterium]
MEPIQLAIIEDNSVVRESLIAFFSTSPEFLVHSTASSVEVFLHQMSDVIRPEPDVLLLDIQLPGVSGISGIPAIRERLPLVDIVILTTFEDSDQIFAALCAGACSYITKQTPLTEIRDALLTVRKGGAYMSPAVARKVIARFQPKPEVAEVALTPRQRDIVQGIVDGLSYKLIAERLGISLDTVRSHVMSIYRALNINSKSELIRRMLDR